MLKGLSIAYVVAGMVDLVQTLYATANGAQEGNPIMALFVDTPIVLSLLKILITIIVILLFQIIWRKDKEKGLWVMWFGVVFQSLVVVSNFIVIGMMF